MIHFTFNGTEPQQITEDEWLETTGYHSFDVQIAAAIGNAIVDKRDYEFLGDRIDGQLTLHGNELGTSDVIVWVQKDDA